MTASTSLVRLLRPRSVAIVGASSTPGALGASVIANLERMKFSGAVHLVNPKRAEIGGRPCLPNVEALPEGIDAAVLAIPRAAVLQTLRSLAARKVGAAVIFSSGFAESGADGLAEQREMARIARSAGMVIEGPNCLGLVNYVDGIALTFVETPAVALGERPGVAIVSQSGAMAAVLGVMLGSRDLGLSYSISTGNEAASSVEDYVEFLLGDPHTRAVGMIVEQFRQPQRFLAVAARARALGKYLVILHPGRSAAARQSAATHTGALAGDWQSMYIKVAQQGVIVAGSLEELGDVIEIVMRTPAPPRGGTAVMTESGAFKALALDLAEHLGMQLPVLTDATTPALRAVLPEFVSVSNPLDLTAQGLVDPGLYGRALAALLSDERLGAIVCALIQTDPVTCGLKFPAIIETLKRLNPAKPVLFAGLDEGAVVPAEYIRELRMLGVPYFPSADRALRAVACIAGQTAAQPTRPARAMKLALPAGDVVPEHAAKALLAPLGIPFPPGSLVRTIEEACAAAATLGYPVALKGQSAQLSHKSDAGAVILDLMNEGALRIAWAQLAANVALHRPGLVLDGVLLEKMDVRGLELIVGGRNDPNWGPVVLVGFGGVQAELLQDIRLLPPDLPREAIIAALGRLRCAALLHGFRGSPAVDLDALAALIETLGDVLVCNPRIAEIDLNPVVAHARGRGVVALDALMSLHE